MLGVFLCSVSACSVLLISGGVMISILLRGIVCVWFVTICVCICAMLVLIVSCVFDCLC